MADKAPTKTNLLQNIAAARKKLETLVNSLTETQLTTPGLVGAWSVKDVLAHLAAWEQLTLERLNAGLGNRPLPMRPIKTDEDVQWMNDKVYARNRDRALAAVREDFRIAHERLMEKVNGLDKKLIQKTAPMEWAGDRPVWLLIAVNTYIHYAEHQETIEKWLAKTGKWTIRAETVDDIPGIRRVEELAFGRPEEANMVDSIRAKGDVALSLAALEGDEIIGHVLFSPVTITAGESVVNGVGLGPVAVLPSHQKQGVGSVLCHEGLVQLAKTGHKFAVVLGHSEYYPRFGFQPAEDYDIRCTWDVPPGAFMVMELEPEALEGVTGMAGYAPEFG